MWVFYLFYTSVSYYLFHEMLSLVVPQDKVLIGSFLKAAIGNQNHRHVSFLRGRYWTLDFCLLYQNKQEKKIEFRPTIAFKLIFFYLFHNANTKEKCLIPWFAYLFLASGIFISIVGPQYFWLHKEFHISNRNADTMELSPPEYVIE
jgi:hypothetical protein